MRSYPLLLITSLTLACAVDNTGPRPMANQVRLSITGANPDGPNVIRFRSSNFAFGIIDLNTDLLAIAGLPDNPKNATECPNGTDNSYSVVDVHEAGVRQDAIKFMANSSDVNLDVYRLSTFDEICTSNTIAHGVGRISYHDNDFYETGGGNNTFGWHMGGPVTLTNGSSVTLLAHNQWQLLPKGLYRRIYRQVKLSGQN
jgi:hypothetical protein